MQNAYKNVAKMGKQVQKHKKTLGSRRYLGRGHGYQVMACQDPDDRGCNLSTAASDTERERVFLCFCTCFPITTTYRPRFALAPNIIKK